MRRAFSLFTFGGLAAAAVMSHPSTAHAATMVGGTRPRVVPPHAVTALPVPPPPVTVTVAPGDTLAALSAAHGVTVDQLGRANGVVDPNVIVVGQVLTVPAATYAAVPYPVEAPPAVAPVRNVPETYVSGTSASSAPPGVWACIAQHESGGNPATDTGNGYEGEYQFSPSTWAANGGVGNAADASAAEQLAVAERVQATQGWGAWPVSSVACGV